MQALSLFAKRLGSTVIPTVSHNAARSSTAVRHVTTNTSSTPILNEPNSGNSAKPFEAHSKVQDPKATPTPGDKDTKSSVDTAPNTSVKAAANVREKEALPKGVSVHETVIQDFSKNSRPSSASKQNDSDKIPNREKLTHGGMGNDWEKDLNIAQYDPAVDGTETNYRQKHVPPQAKGPAPTDKAIPNSSIDATKETTGYTDSETMRDVKHKAHELEESAKDKASELKNRAENKAHNLKENYSDKASNFKDRMENKAENLKDKAENKYENLKDKASNKAENLKNKMENKLENMSHEDARKVDHYADKADMKAEKGAYKTKDKVNDMAESAKNKADSASAKLHDKASSSDWSESAKEKAHDAAEVIKEKTHEYAEVAKDKAHDMAESAKEWVQDKAKDVRQSIKDKL